MKFQRPIRHPNGGSVGSWNKSVRQGWGLGQSKNWELPAPTVYLKAWDWWGQQGKESDRRGWGAEPQGQSTTRGQGEHGGRAEETEGAPRRPGKNQKLRVSWKQNSFEERIVNSVQSWWWSNKETENWPSDLAVSVKSWDQIHVHSVSGREGWREMYYIYHPLCVGDFGTKRNVWFSPQQN